MALRSTSLSARWLNRFAWFTAAMTLFLICSGGMVTSKGYGLAVPDWPTTFGYNMFLFPVSHWIGGIFFEHTHRLIASIVGILTIILAIWLWRMEDRQPSRREPSEVKGEAREILDAGRRPDQCVRSLGVIAVAGVILQGILGGLRVTMLRDQIGILHACVAQAFFALLVFIALARTNLWRSLANADVDLAPIKRIAIATTVLIYIQLALGATMRHQHRDLAILDFPTANGVWIPDTSDAALAKINNWRDARALSDVTAFQIWLQMTHRVMAAIIGVALLMTCSRILRHVSLPALRRLSILWVALFLCQFTLGAWTIWSNKAADVATAHVAVGATMLAFGVSISAILARMTAMPARSTSSLAFPVTAI